MVVSLQEYEEKEADLITTIQKYLFITNEQVFDKLDYYKDEIYLDPFLYACANKKVKERAYLDFLIFVLSDKKEGQVAARTDGKGMVYVPNYGYVYTGREHQILSMTYDASEKRYHFFETDDLQKELTIKVEPLVKSEEGIEFLVHNHPLIRDLFTDPKGNNEVDIDPKYLEQHRQHFRRAMDLIKELYPSYYELICRSVKKVVLYKGSLNSFATFQVHGIAFFNVEDYYDEVFFVDNICHQCAHVIFNTLTLEKEKLFAIDPDSDLSEFTGDSEITGNLYGKFHGMFTQSNINTCISRCLEKGIFSGKQLHEIQGRLAYNMKRFSSSLSRFDHPHLYQEEGLRWYNKFKVINESLYEKHKDIIESYYIFDQPYVFDYPLFAASNPMQGVSA